MPGFPVVHHLPELAQTHVHQEGMCFCRVPMFASDGCLDLSSGVADEGWCWWRGRERDLELGRGGAAAGVGGGMRNVGGMRTDFTTE